MAERPYLTTAEAAEYCGFKTIGGIQQAVRRGKLKPAGRRGGTGTYVFVREDLDAFLTGGLAPHGRMFVAPVVESSGVGKASPPRAVLAPPQAALPAAASRRTRAAGGASYPLAESASSPSPLEDVAAELPPVRARKPAEAEDPVARIIRALSGPANKPARKKKASRAA